jgi:ADP-ribosyltransferase exoenzyme
MTTEKYAKKHLSREIQLIESSTERLNALPELTVYEKAIIFKYSEDGYFDLNEKLRLSEGKDISDFGIHLDECLSKMRDYQDVVYRGITLTDSELERYRLSFNDNEPLREYFFVSSSKSRLKAYEWCNKRNKVLFEIFSFKGKVVEFASKYPAEKEILFRYNSDFWIEDFIFDEERNLYLITKTEI